MGTNSNSSNVAGKPTIQRKDFPLWLHPSGRWCRKIKGQFFYFGKDQGAALEEWLRVKDDLLAGRTPRPKVEGLSLGELGNHFLTAKKRKLQAGELSARSFADLKSGCDRLVGFIGKNRIVADIRPDDLGLYRAHLVKDQGPYSVARYLQTARSLFKFGFDTGLLETPVRLGTEFKRPSAAVIRKHKASRPKRFLQPNQIRDLLAKADLQMRAMILLGVNCGLGNTDISELNWQHLDLEAGMLNFPRLKTGIERRAALWPETVTALRALKAWATSSHTTGEARGLPRYRPSRPEDKDAVFITKYQTRWIAHITKGEGEETTASIRDSVGLMFGRLLREVGAKAEGVNFYALRHVTETVGQRAKDQAALDKIMGHVADASDMSDNYLAWGVEEAPEDQRLRAVADVLRAWLRPDLVGALTASAMENPASNIKPH